MSKREHLAQGTAPGMIPHDSERMDDPGVSRWMNMFNGRNGGNGIEMGSLRRELQGLEMIENQTKRSLEAMKIRRVSLVDRPSPALGLESDPRKPLFVHSRALETTTIRSDDPGKDL
jgi:hypothetical protein